MKIFPKVFILFFGLLIVSCGQVGNITGGPKDEIAPRILSKEVSPPINSTSIYPKTISIPFDEFIKFNKPAKNIFVTPADVKLDYTIKGKSVELKVKEGSWQPNTTYTIYLNRAVQDITEGNDSIMAYVFSTGTYIDSLQTAVQIVDAYSGKPQKDITVGLYTEILKTDTGKLTPRYFASTDKDGIATFKNLKQKKYFVYAFKDQNRNNILNTSEARGQLGKVAKLSDSIDTIIPVIRLMPPKEQQLKVKSNVAVAPGIWCLGFNKAIKDTSKFQFIDTIPTAVIWNKEKDSLTAFYKTGKDAGAFFAVLKKDTTTDTIFKRYFFNKKILTIENNLNNKILEMGDTFTLKLNDPIVELDSSKLNIQAIANDDSLKRPISYRLLKLSPITLGFIFPKKIKKVFFSLPPNGIIARNTSLKDSLNLDFTIQTVEETGNLIIAFDSIPQPGILFIEGKDKEHSYKILVADTAKREYQLQHLQPGKYTYHFLFDEDHNGAWTTGSIFENTGAEKVKWFSQVSTVRGNWDVKTNLSFKEGRIRP